VAEIRNAGHRSSVGNSQEKRQLGKSRCRRDNDINKNVRYTRCHCVGEGGFKWLRTESKGGFF
jgi:hypothetical protein